MKIAIDIDEVIVEFLKGYLKIHEDRSGIRVFFEDIFSYSLWKPLEIPEEEAMETMEEFYNSEHFDKLEIVEGARESILKLSENNELFFVTARPSSLKKQTENFFHMNFNGIPLRVFYSGDYFGGRKTKAEICKTLGISIIIEDNGYNAIDCARNGVKVFLLDKPWNKDYELHENVIRVKNWNEILEQLK